MSTFDWALEGKNYGIRIKTKMIFFDMFFE
jgi:hypothetical protein